MRKVVLVLILFSFAACKSSKLNSNEAVFTSKNEVIESDYVIKIDKIVSDSRCPEGTNCIWAGELVLQLSVWENNEIIETKVLTFSPNTRDENLAWFEKYIPYNKKLAKYKISPIKTEKQLELKDYKMELILE